MEENYKDEMIVIDNVNRYNEIFGLETKHPLVSIIDLTKSTTWPTRAWFRYEVYALFLKNVKCGDIKYGRQYYDYQDGTIVCFGPGQITDLELIQNIQPNAHGLLFHPDLIRGTSLGQEIKNYSFFSYETNEALHLSEEERQIVMDCLQKIAIELNHAIDRHSRRLICTNIRLLLDYCMRFYERQFEMTAIFGSVYNHVTGYFGDILSYSRLMTLMLAGSVIASVFNTLGAIPGNVVFFLLVSAAGNGLNFALNLLSCYVHDLRLQCLEYFGKFYQDGGKPFEPLAINTKYVDIQS